MKSNETNFNISMYE